MTVKVPRVRPAVLLATACLSLALLPPRSLLARSAAAPPPVTKPGPCGVVVTHQQPRPTATPRRTGVPTHTPTPTASPSATDTYVPAATDTPTESPTFTPTPVDTATSTPSPLPTATSAPAPPLPPTFPTPTPTTTLITFRPTATILPTATPTATQLVTSTPIRVPTRTPTPFPTLIITYVPPTGAAAGSHLSVPAGHFSGPMPKPRDQPAAPRRRPSPDVVCVWTARTSAGHPVAGFPAHSPVYFLAAWHLAARPDLKKATMTLRWTIYRGLQVDLSAHPPLRAYLTRLVAKVPGGIAAGTFRLRVVPSLPHLTLGWYSVVARARLYAPNCPHAGCSGRARQTRFYHY